MARTLHVVIGCDTDPDRQGFIREPIEEGRSWRGMLEGIPKAKTRLATCLDAAGHAPVISWCLRADFQVKHFYGRCAAIVERHKDFFLGLEQTGDELAWHPHFWRFDDTLGKWYQEVDDTEWQINMLREAFADYRAVLPNRPKSVRMGWDYHNDKTVAALDSLGIAIDFTGIPGLRTMPKGTGSRGYNFYDWQISPTRPYYPSKADYRRPARDGEQSYDLIEAPNFVAESWKWGLLTGLVLAKKMRDPRQLAQALSRPVFFVGITGRPFLFATLIKQLDKAIRKSDELLFVSYFHPDELLIEAEGLYSLGNMAANIRAMLDWAKRAGVEVRFSRAEQIPLLVRVAGQAKTSRAAR